MRLLPTTATLAATLAFGAIVMGHGLLVPALLSQSELFDVNLAHAASRVATEMTANIALGCCALAALLTPRWQDKKTGLTLALIAVIAALLDRALAIPQMHDTWRFVDFVTQRPAGEFADAQRWQLAHWSLAGTIALCSVSLCLRGLKLTEHRAIQGALARVGTTRDPAVEATQSPAKADSRPQSSTLRVDTDVRAHAQLSPAPPVGRRRQNDTIPPVSNEMATHNNT